MQDHLHALLTVSRRFVQTCILKVIWPVKERCVDAHVALTA